MKPFYNAFLDELSPAQKAQLEQAQNETNQSQTLESRQFEEQAPTKSKAWDTPEKDFNQRIANAGARDFEIAALEDQESNRLETHLNLRIKATIAENEREIERLQAGGELAPNSDRNTVEDEIWQLEHLNNMAENAIWENTHQSYEETNNIGDGWASPEQIAENVKAQAAITGAEEAPSFRDELTTQSREALERYEIKQEKEPMDISIGSEISQSQGEGQRLKAE